VTFYITLTRRGGYYIMHLIIPVCGMVMLSTASFYLPAESGDKTSVVIVVYLSQLVSYLVLGIVLPKQSDIVTLVGRWR